MAQPPPPPNPPPPQNPPHLNPMHNLANQIANLVQQMQLAQPQQINLPVAPRELNLVSYPEFMGGEQDPISWLEDVEKAFEANRIDNARKIPVIVPKLKGSASTWWVAMRNQNPPIDRWSDNANPGLSFKANFITKFRTTELEGKWFAQLTQRKQLPGESVDSYHVAVEEMICRVEAGGHQYPDSAKAQMFINGLRSELFMAVSPFTPNTLQAAYERAKAFENTYKQNPTYAAFLGQTSGYPFQVAQYQNNSAQPPILTSTGTDEAINKLTEAVNKMMIQIQDQRRPQRNYQPNPRNPNPNPIVCYNCGRPGHISRNCTTPRQTPIANNPPVPPSNDANPQEALLALMNLLQQTTQPEVSEECPAYLGFTAEDTSIFTSAEVELRKNNPIETRAKKRKVEEGKAVLVEEIPGNNENKEESRPTLVRRNPPEEKKKKPALIRKKKLEDDTPQISSLVAPYSIVAEIRDKPANITFGQLFKAAPSMRTDLIRSLQKKKIIRRKLKSNVNLQNTQKSTALYCDAKVQDKVIPLIVDSGSSGSVVSSYLLKDLGIKIDRPSTVNMINVHGESKRAIREIAEFPFVVGGMKIPIDVVVTDANSYNTLVGNDWLSKVSAIIDWNNCEMTLTWKGKEVIVPVEFKKVTPKTA